MFWPFLRPDADTRTSFGYIFQLTDHHLTPDQMHPMKQSYDTLGEKAWEKLDSLNSHGTGQNPLKGKRDLYVLLRQNVSNDKSLGQLWSEVNTVPSWVCWDQIARGQDCFYRYGGPVLNGLAFQSLLGGMVRSFDLLHQGN